MAKRSPLAAARGALLSMVLLMVVMAAGIFGSTYSGGSWAPKLALDLSGGTQMILSPKVNGSSDGNVTQEQLNQAVEIIRQRVDGAGVSEAEVTTSFGSGNNVVVSVPGTISSETRQLIQASANMTFRPVLVAGEGAAVAEDPAPRTTSYPSRPPSRPTVRTATGLPPTCTSSTRRRTAPRPATRTRIAPTRPSRWWPAPPTARRSTSWAPWS